MALSLGVHLLTMAKRERAAVAARSTSRSNPKKRKATAMLTDSKSPSIPANVTNTTSKQHDVNQVSEPTKTQEHFNGLAAEEKNAVSTLLDLCQPERSSSHSQALVQAGSNSEISVHFAQNLVAALTVCILINFT